MQTPDGTAPSDWDAYIAAAPTFLQAQDRIREAAEAGVDMRALSALALKRITRARDERSP